MNDIRVKIQTALNTISNLDTGNPKPDGLIEKGKTYFGYTLQESYQNENFDKDYIMEIALTGYIVRKQDPTENTLQFVDTALESIKTKLKDMNFKYSYNDVSEYQDGFVKIAVKANVKYSELNKKFIL